MERKQVIIASIWVIGVFGLSQLLRLGSNLIVTRLLEPEMFGLMAVVLVVMHGLAMFSDLGLWAFIVRHKEGVDSNMLNTVWSIQVIRGWGIFIIILLLASTIFFVKYYFEFNLNGVYGDEDFPLILIITGAVVVIRGYKTMAPAVESRELKRGKLELIELAAQISGATVMIAWAWNNPTIWALISAGIVTSAVSLLLTYTAFPIRHQFAWNKKTVVEVYDFGKWIVLASILTFIAAQGDRLFFGASISARQLGIYSVAFMLANTIISVVQQLSMKVLFPVFGRTVNRDRLNLKSAYYSARLKLDLVVFFLAGLLLALAPVIINFLYDERYAEAGPMLQVLVFSIIGSAFSISALECLSALSITKIRMQVMLVRSVGLLAGLPIFFSLYGFYGALWVVTVNIWLGIPVIYWVMYKQKLFSFFSEIKMSPFIAVGYFSGLALIGELYL